MADIKKELMKPRPIFNPEGNDDPAKRGILHGDTTNIFNLNVIKYE
ncbi:MAG: ribonucleoside-diphosphate reductase, partial [Desulfurobacterium sp.]